jgi:hypothetical protein
MVDRVLDFMLHDFTLFRIRLGNREIWSHEPSIGGRLCIKALWCFEQSISEWQRSLLFEDIGELHNMLLHTWFSLSWMMGRLRSLVDETRM